MTKEELNIVFEHLAPDVGVYCKSIVYPDGTEIKRSPYGDGWNDAVLEITQLQIKAMKVLREQVKTGTLKSPQLVA